MPAPTANTDVGLVIATMVIENAYASRTNARHDRQDAAKSMAEAQKKQIAELRRQADQNYKAAMAEAQGKMLGGLMGIAGGALALGYQKRELSEIGSSTGSVLASCYGMYGAELRELGEQAGATAKAAEMEASSHKERLDAADDEAKEAREHMRTALDFLRQFQATEAKSMESAIRA